jgi:hypothetical protein
MKEVRACCAAAPAERGWTTIVGPEAMERSFPPGEVLRLAQGDDLARKPWAAVHEAGHATMAVALGVSVNEATIDNQPCVRFGVELKTYSDVEIAVMMSGPIADCWSVRRIYEPRPECFISSIERTRQLEGGNCDECRIARGALVRTRFAPTEVVGAYLQHLELQVTAFVRCRPIWLAILRVADALKERGTLSGDEILKITDQFFEAGSARLVPFTPTAQERSDVTT